MAVKNSLVSTIFEKITPFIKKEAKTNPNRIYFKPSDLPPEELSEQITQEVKVADNALPFAERLIHPDMFGLTPAVVKTKQVVDRTSEFIEQFKDEAIKEHFSKLYPKILDSSKNIHKDSHRMTSLMSSIELIDNPKIKAEILDKIDFLNRRNPKDFKYFYEGLMEFSENYADAVNTINGKYLNINNDARKFYKWMDKKNIWLLDIIDGTKKSEGTYRKGLLSSKTRNKKYPEYLKNYDEYTQKGLSETYENNLKHDALRRFFDKYFNTRKEAIKTLYHEEYLKILPPDVAKECADVQNKYGTYIITSNHDITPADIKYIKEELRLWQTAGKNESIMPNVIHVNAIDEYLLKNHSSGVATGCDKSIKVRELLQDDGNAKSDGATLRHEIQHLHDKDAFKRKNTFENITENLEWRYYKLKYGKRWEKELENGGIKAKGHRTYGLGDKAEMKSVTAETDTEQLTDSFKEDMTEKLEMQPWIFRLGKNKIAQQSKLESEKI